MGKSLKMIFKNICKVFILSLVFIVSSVFSLAEDGFINSLSQIAIDKPIDNSYLLSLYFKDNFQGNAFLQKRKNGSFYVYIPDTVMSSRHLKMIYRGKVSQEDVKISIEEQPFIKEDGQSRYLRLSVDTPVNSDIQLTAQKFIPSKTKIGGSIMSLYSIILAVLLSIVVILSVSIYRAIKSINKNSNSYTTFPAEFLNAPKEYTRVTVNNSVTSEKPAKIDVDAKIISPIAPNDFSCFNLPLKKAPVSTPISSAMSKSINAPSIEDRTVQSIASAPIRKQTVISNEENELELPTAEDINIVEGDENSQIAEKVDDEYRPELISELKIGNDKGFYLTTVGENSFALFGYVGEKIFFLQKFNDLTQVNLQARFYDKKDDKDLYIIKLDSYKAMLAVSDAEIKELAVI